MTSPERALTRTLVDGLPDPALLLDPELRIVHHNPAFVAFTELRGRRFERALAHASSPFELLGTASHREIASRCIASGRPTRLEDVTVSTPGGIEKTAVVAFIPVRDVAGVPIGLVYSLRDVTGDVTLHKRYKRLLGKERERVKALEARQSAVMDDLQEAKLFQESLLPDLPEVEGLAFAVRFLPAEMVSGDIYDVTPLPDGARVMISDATGHGVQASLRTMVIRTEYDQIKQSAPDPAALLGRINQRFAENYRHAQLHFTACCFDVLRRNKEMLLRYASAGHPGLLRVSGGRVSEIHVNGPFPGLLPDVEFGTLELRLAPGDRLIGFTDGLTEQARVDGTRFDDARIPAMLEGLGGSIDDALDRVVSEVTRFLGGDPQTDDLTLIGVEVL